MSAVESSEDVRAAFAEPSGWRCTRWIAAAGLRLHRHLCAAHSWAIRLDVVESCSLYHTLGQLLVLAKSRSRSAEPNSAILHHAPGHIREMREPQSWSDRNFKMELDDEESLGCDRGKPVGYGNGSVGPETAVEQQADAGARAAGRGRRSLAQSDRQYARAHQPVRPGAVRQYHLVENFERSTNRRAAHRDRKSVV